MRPSDPAARNPRIGVVGLGHVGVATALSFARHGREVYGIDSDPLRVRQIRRGAAPFFDRGLREHLRRSTRRNELGVVGSPEDLVTSCDLIFLCVPTPSRRNGAVDLSYVRSAVSGIGGALRHKDGWVTVVVKSTVPPGTVDGFVRRRLEQTSGKHCDQDFGVASNPEFLAEGTMLEDSFRPHRIILGVRERRSEALLRTAYARFPSRILVMDPASAELAKYASNAMLATRVSFTNEIGSVAERVGADIYQVMEGVGLDPRIGALFLRAGPGFGGSCFTKDLTALVEFAQRKHIQLRIPRATLETNLEQARHVIGLAADEVGTLRDRRVAVLGLAFKASTDDARGSQALPMVRELLARGARPVLFDPQALESFRVELQRDGESRWVKRISWARSATAALSISDLAIIQTDWPEFRRLPSRTWTRLRLRVVIDARRSVNGRALERAGMRYRAVGLGRTPPDRVGLRHVPHSSE